MQPRWLIIGDPDWTPLSAWADGLRSVGVASRWTLINDWAREECDAVAIYGLRFHGRDVLEYYEKRGVPVVVIDHGYMKRVNVAADLPTGYLQVGVNRLGWVPPAAPSADRLNALGVEVRERERKPIRRAVIMGQVPHDASHRMPEARLVQCYEKLYEELQAAGIKNVAFRAHPLGHVDPKIPKDGMSPCDDAIRRADLVVSLNSNAGLEAIIDGCPAVTLLDGHYSELAYRWPVLPGLIEPPPPARVTSFLERLAYAQWTDAEIREGKPYLFLQSIGAIP